MTISHHPSDQLLTRFSSGSLEEADRLAIAVHASQCALCRRLIGAIEDLGGISIEQAPPVAMRCDAFDAVLARIEQAPITRMAVQNAFTPMDDDLPEVLRYCRFGKQRRVAPGVKLQPIILPNGGTSRAFLLWSAPGSKMLEHTHSGTELTCVLKGSFAHEGGHYGPGDFDFGDDHVDHQPVVGADQPCLCFVAMAGDLKPNGWLGRIVAPFIRL